MITPFTFSREHILTKAHSRGRSVGYSLAVCIAVPMTMCPFTCALTVSWGRGADRHMGITAPSIGIRFLPGSSCGTSLTSCAARVIWDNIRGV